MFTGIGQILNMHCVYMDTQQFSGCKNIQIPGSKCIYLMVAKARAQLTVEDREGEGGVKNIYY